LNFTVTDIESLVESSTITPQVSDHIFVGNSQHDITAYCRTTASSSRAFPG